MSSYQVLSLLLLFGVCGVVFCLVLFRAYYHKARQMENKYYLYAVRDDLIQLVADGHLTEDSFIFSELYPAVNELINQINSFRFSHIVRALNNQDKLVTASEYRQKFIQEINAKPVPVRKVFFDLNCAIAKIIFRNSLLFRAMFRFSRIHSLVQKHIVSGIPLITDQMRAHEYYMTVNTCL